MENILDWELFETIFSDAHVLDIDLSSWDKSIVLYVIADHVPWSSRKRLPMFAVSFNRVQRFTSAFRHLDIELDDPAHHFQWRIEDFEIAHDGSDILIKLIGAGYSPAIEVVFENFQIKEVDLALIDQKFPGWSKPYSGFIRRGIL